jgi:hypothetical protein
LHIRSALTVEYGDLGVHRPRRRGPDADSEYTCYWIVCGHVSLSGAAAPRRGPRALQHCYCAVHEVNAGLRAGVPLRPSSRAVGAIVEACGTGEEEAGLRARGARKGFPDDMLEAINNALFYVHEKAGKQRSGAAQLAADCRRAVGPSAADVGDPDEGRDVTGPANVTQDYRLVYSLTT